MIEYICAACAIVWVIGMTIRVAVLSEEARRQHKRIDELAIAMRSLVEVVDLLNRMAADFNYQTAKPPFQSMN